MADWFVDSTAGANSNSGTVYTAPKKYLWVNDGTAATLVGATKPIAGDTVYVLDGHTEDPATGLTLSGGAAVGTALIRITNVASFNSGSPNTLGVANGCTVGKLDGTYVAGSNLRLSSGFDIYGFSFVAADEMLGTATNANLSLTSCRLQQNRAGTTRTIQLSASSEGIAEFFLTDVWYKFASANHLEGVGCGGVKVIVRGGGLESTAATVFGGFIDGGELDIDGFDFTNATTFCASGTTAGDGTICHINIRNSFIPATFTLPVSMRSPGQTLRATNCKNAAGFDSEVWVEHTGSVISETTAVRTGGAEVGGAGYSYEMLPNTSVSRGHPLKCLTITGQSDFSTAKTIDIYVANITRGLNDQEIYFDLSYPTYNQGGNTLTSSQPANARASATTVTDDTTSTWGTSPTFMQKMSITAGGATDGREGPYQIDVYLAADVDVFVDPLPVIT